MNQDYPALHELDCDPQGFSWIAADDAEKSIYTFCRQDRSGNTIVVVLNFTPAPHVDYRIGVPKSGKYVEILNSDSKLYGGSNVGNLGSQISEEVASHGCQQSLQLNIPPLAIIMLSATGKSEKKLVEKRSS